MVTPNPTKQPVVAVQSLTKVFKDFWLRSRARAVDDVTFSVEQGEIFGLLGPNGSGKSTTIKIILGLLKQTSGRAAVFGKPPTDVQAKKRIGYLPEESYLYPFLNARETLDYYGKLFQLDRTVRIRRTDELLEMVGLSAVQLRPIREYSKGMARRIGLAQALINDPEMLILDEPTSGLDPIGTRQVKDLLNELGRRGKTILLSSHILADVEDCVDRMVILYGGKIREQGTCDELLETEGKSIISTDELDPETLAQVRELILARTGKPVTSVTRPRQSLEDKFIAIVKRASERNVATSGATHGGQTAEFLRAGPAGQELIDDLVKKDQQTAEELARAVREAEQAKKAAAATRGPDTSVISNLTNPQVPAAPSSGPKPETPAPAQEVDASLISSLLGGSPASKPGASSPPSKPGSPDGGRGS